MEVITIKIHIAKDFSDYHDVKLDLNADNY